jgi:hypothetical protein
MPTSPFHSNDAANGTEDTAILAEIFMLRLETAAPAVKEAARH